MNHFRGAGPFAAREAATLSYAFSEGGLFGEPFPYPTGMGRRAVKCCTVSLQNPRPTAQPGRRRVSVVVVAREKPWAGDHPARVVRSGIESDEAE